MNNFFKIKKDLYLIIFFLILGFLFFTFHINTFDLHFDEIHWFYWSDPNLTFLETIQRFNNYNSPHPPLFSFISKLVLNFKNETHILRYINSTNMMINSLLFFFVLKKIFNDYSFCFFGVILFISNIFIIFYSQRYTNYSLLLTFELLSFLYFLKLIEKNNFKNLIIFYIINFLGLSTHLYFLLFLAPITLFLIINIKTKTNIIISIILSISTFLLIFNNFISNAFKIGFSNTNITLDLINSHFLVYFFGGKYLAYLAYFLIILFCIYLIHKRTKKDFIYIFFLIIPYLAVYFFNLLIGNAWVDGKHLIFFIPILIIIFMKTTFYLKTLYKKKYLYIIPIFLILIGQLIALYRNYYPNEFNKNLVRRNVELKQFLNKTKNFHKFVFVVEKGEDKWPGFNHNLKYYLERNKDFKNTEIILINTESDQFKNLNEFMYIYFRDTENSEAKKRIIEFKKQEFVDLEKFKDYQIKGLYFKKL